MISGDAEEVKNLINKGANVNAKYADNLTCLHFAAGWGNFTFFCYRNQLKVFCEFG